MVHFVLSQKLKNGPRLTVRFYCQEGSGVEPVRDWIRSLPDDERKVVGEDIKAVQYGWPLGLPLVDHVDGGVWEVRSKLKSRIARVLFAVEGTLMILLHGFIKKTEKTPRHDIVLAKDRLKKMRGAQ